MTDLRRIKTDMELPFVDGIQTGYHSRTLLPGFSHLPGGETTATVQVHCDLKSFKGNVQYPPIWMESIIQGLNKGSKQAENYLFRKAGGIQNSETKGRMQQVLCEDNVVEVIRQDHNKCFLACFNVNNKPPAVWDIHDPRVQRITVVNRLDQITRSIAIDVYFPIMGRKGEELWIDEMYLGPIGPIIPPGPQEFSSGLVIVGTDKSVRLG